jgi:CBS domain containing-hemolysin-like protein
MSESAPLADAVERLKRKETNMVVGVDAAGKAIGVMTRALRRY